MTEWLIVPIITVYIFIKIIIQLQAQLFGLTDDEFLVGRFNQILTLACEVVVLSPEMRNKT